MTGLKTAFSGMKNPCDRVSCFWLETFRDFHRRCIPPNARRATGVPRPGKSRRNFFRPLCCAAAGNPTGRAGCRDAFKSETFRASRPGPGNAGFAGTLDTPGFHSGWPALCVSVGTAVDDVTTGRF
jgi:hypothetical protein